MFGKCYVFHQEGGILLIQNAARRLSVIPAKGNLQKSISMYVSHNKDDCDMMQTVELEDYYQVTA